MLNAQEIVRLMGLSKPANNIRARRAFILNVLLLGMMGLVLIGLLIHGVVMAVRPLDPLTYTNNSLPWISLVLLLSFFAALHVLSLRGHSLFSSHVFTWSLFGLAVYMGTRWGVDVTVSILFYVLSVVVSGILISTRLSLVVLTATAVSMGVLGQAQHTGFLNPEQYWRTQLWNQGDTAMTVVILAIVAAVCALSSWQAEHALARAVSSEEALKKERDQLEDVVEQRTRELRLVQMERLANVYRFAEFGRLSSGLFHNLANLLTAMTLNTDRLKGNQVWEADAVKTDIGRVISTNNKMREFVDATRRQFAGERHATIFSAAEEVREMVQVVSHRAQECAVDIQISVKNSDTFLFGIPAIFNQIVANLVSNAIDAYQNLPRTGEREWKVCIDVGRQENGNELRVKDWGCGIPKNLQEKVFEPFFTTKSSTQGMGIGLALVKRMIEKDFHGSVHLESEEGIYTEITVIFPDLRPSLSVV